MATRGLLPEVAERLEGLTRALRSQGVPISVTSTFRSRAQQEELYRAWLARGRRGLPAAVPGTSTHEFGYAVDLVPVRPGDLQHVVRQAECFGLKWAGPGDRVHFDVWGPAVWRLLLADKPLPRNFGYRC